jgi:hypothetical protein
MLKTTFDILTPLLAATVVGLALRKWHIIRDRNRIIATIRNALSTQSALWVGIPAGIAYLAIFMILGGQGGRVHLLFGRVIWNTNALDVLTGMLLATLVLLSVSLFVFGAGRMGVKRSGREGGIGLAGSMLAVIAAFCP